MCTQGNAKIKMCMYKTTKVKKPVEKVLTGEKKCGNIIKLSVIPMRKKRKGLVKKFGS